MTQTRVVHVTPNAEALLAWLLRICYNRYAKADALDAAKRLRHCITQGHFDTLRQTSVVFDLPETGYFSETELALLDLIRDNPFVRHSEYRDDPGNTVYRVSANFQSMFDLYFKYHAAIYAPTWWDRLEPVFEHLKRECPNIFGRHPDPVPIEHWKVEPLVSRTYGPDLKVELWARYDDPNPVHSYATFYAEFDEGSQRQHIRHLFGYTTEQEAWEGTLVESTRYVNQSDRRFLWPPVAYLSDEKPVYTDQLENGDIVTMEGKSPRETAAQVFKSHEFWTRQHYNQLIGLGVKQEDARAILPLAKETRLFFTGRGTVLQNYLDLRTEKKAQRHLIRPLATEMLDILGAPYLTEYDA